MEQNAFFRWIMRINSIFFLIFILMGIGLIVFITFEGNDWNSKRTVEIQDKSENKIKMRLGSIASICGLDIQYIELRSINTSKGFSSGRYSEQARNVVFLAGADLSPHWLYDTNDYLIQHIAQLNPNGYDCDEKATLAVLYKVIKYDSNKDGLLSEDDSVTVAVTLPDGNRYTELGSYDSVIDHETDQEGKILTLLVQVGSDIVVQKYSLTGFKKLSDRILTGIEKKT